MTPVGSEAGADSAPCGEAETGVVRSVQALRARVDAWRGDGLKVGFVPTMGALHEGHLSLVRKSLAIADRTVTSIFVNPKQFSPGEDLDTYPRDEKRDLALLRALGCHLAYIPSAEEMYPPGYQTSVAVADLSNGLCGASRPHFFGGVATVVCKLLNQCRPDLAVFGEKDYQQLLIIRRMARDLDIDVDIIGGEIAREEDGLAMSSRNAYLSDDERAVAGKLNVVIADMAAKLARGARVDIVIAEGRAALTAAGFPSIDYLEVRAAEDLAPQGPGPIAAPSRVFAAAMLGRTRLIDNWPVD
ncbi:MAG: pantoate--beta-alanine ligase [Parvularculaceae bacterium]